MCYSSRSIHRRVYNNDGADRLQSRGWGCYCWRKDLSNANGVVVFERKIIAKSNARTREYTPLREENLQQRNGEGQWIFIDAVKILEVGDLVKRGDVLVNDYTSWKDLESRENASWFLLSDRKRPKALGWQRTSYFSYSMSNTCRGLTGRSYLCYIYRVYKIKNQNSKN